MKGRPEPRLSNPEWIADLAFTVDMCAFLNELNVKLQGNGLLINDMVSKIKAFEQKLKLLKNGLLQKDTTHFSELRK